jgi:hypothetical protein
MITRYLVFLYWDIKIIVVLLTEKEGGGELILYEIAVSRFPELSATQNVIKMWERRQKWQVEREEPQAAMP